MNSHRTSVAVLPGQALSARPRLFAALAAAFEIVFEPWTPDARPAAVLSLGGAAPAELASLRAPVLAFADGRENGGERFEVLAHARVDRRVRGLALEDRLAGEEIEDDEVLAVSGGRAVWTRSNGTAPVQRLRARLPELAEDELLFNALSARPLAFVALIQFLRELTAPGGWTPPPLRASIVFDDPNVRWRRYGFIDYRELVAHADRHDYHAVMAMIPIDAAWAHGPTVELFRRRRDRLSLVFHGNDHVKRELMRPPTRDAALSLLSQALRRVERFERRTRLAVDRVMMPPHGMAARTMAQALAALGFDSLCAIHPLPWTETPPGEQPLVGWRPGEFVDGCAVIPRIPLSSSRSDIALRAFMDHPVVLYGHHDDLADGLDVLATAADAVNGLGDVRWIPSEEIAASNYALRLDGETATVRPYARRIQVQLPAGATELRVQAPDAALDAAALTGWSSGADSRRAFGDASGAGPDRRLELRLHARDAADATSIALPPWRPWPRLRRTATEVRDRMLPLRPRRS
ncbi:hypothetical protein [Candidatus Solirubrobacter pratensis]|uniref:hypothetical protein n=1 Tax=Candidatus Solirubrobacter pratensis TaxID=1298857 RepID=UPI00041D7B09|nr:hypothetical protein [Candidatus Solirubrobacter pratensis]